MSWWTWEILQRKPTWHTESRCWEHIWISRLRWKAALYLQCQSVEKLKSLIVWRGLSTSEWMDDRTRMKKPSLCPKDLETSPGPWFHVHSSAFYLVVVTVLWPFLSVPQSSWHDIKCINTTILNYGIFYVLIILQNVRIAQVHCRNTGK